VSQAVLTDSVEVPESAMTLGAKRGGCEVRLSADTQVDYVRETVDAEFP
jgi:hypothetical protein